MLESIEKVFSSHKRLYAFLFIATFTLSIPFTISLTKQRQDVRQRAAESDETAVLGPDDTIVKTQSGGCSSTKAGLDEEEKKMINLINDYREAHGLNRMKISGFLNNVASSMAEDQARVDVYTKHIDSTGRDFETRLADCNYTYNQYGGASENVGWGNGPGLTDRIFNGWLNSPGHYANLMRPENKTTGIARGVSASGNTYWTNEFSLGDPGGEVTDDESSDPSPSPSSTPTTFPGTLTPTTLQASPSAISTSVSLKISIPGIGANANVGENNNPVAGLSGQLELSNSSDQKLTYDLTFNYASPKFEASKEDLTAGTYNLKLRTNNSLWNNLGPITLIANKNITILSEIVMVTGDLNQDNRLDLADYNLIISCYGSASCSQKETSDLNLDGKVDEKDLNIFYSGLAKRQGD